MPAKRKRVEQALGPRLREGVVGPVKPGRLMSVKCNETTLSFRGQPIFHCPTFWESGLRLDVCAAVVDGELHTSRSEEALNCLPE